MQDGHGEPRVRDRRRHIVADEIRHTAADDDDRLRIGIELRGMLQPIPKRLRAAVEDVRLVHDRARLPHICGMLRQMQQQGPSIAPHDGVKEDHGIANPDTCAVRAEQPAALSRLHCRILHILSHISREASAFGSSVIG